MKYLNILLFAMLCLFACKSDPTSDFKKLDLLQYGMPIDIAAPDSAKVKASDLGVMKDITVIGEDGYSLQIFSSDATTTDPKSVKDGLLSDVKAGLYFSKIVEEYDNGFIFEKKIGERINYDFRFVKLQADKEYTFQTALMGTFSEEQVRTMYESVQ